MQGVFAYEQLVATIQKHGEQERLRVGGTVTMRHPGWTLTLRLHDGPGFNLGINPPLLLDLVLQPPEGGPTLPEVHTRTEIEPFEIEAVLRYRQVMLNLVGTLDEPPPPIEVVRLEEDALP